MPRPGERPFKYNTSQSATHSVQENPVLAEADLVLGNNYYPNS